MPNGNYEERISGIQHKCASIGDLWKCVEYGWDIGKLYLIISDGDPYEDGYENKIEVPYCPFCGMKADDK